MRELTVDLFSTVDGFAKGRNSPAYFGYGGPDLDAWIGEQVATPHVVLMGGNTYRALAEIAATGADPRMDELPKLVFSASLRPPLIHRDPEDITMTRIRRICRSLGLPRPARAVT